MRKLRVIPALLAVGCLSLAGTSQLLAQTNSTSTARVESAQDGRQDEDRRRADRPRDRTKTDAEQIGLATDGGLARTGPSAQA